MQLIVIHHLLRYGHWVQAHTTSHASLARKKKKNKKNNNNKKKTMEYRPKAMQKLISTHAINCFFQLL